MKVTPELIALARAIQAADERPSAAIEGIGDGFPDDVSDWGAHLAIAALEALYEPTREMIYVGDTVSEDAGDIWDPSGGCSHTGPQCGREVWQAMLRTALGREG